MIIGFCGLGLMGSVMVKRLLQAGHQVKVWNRSKDKAKALVQLGAQLCLTPQEAATNVDGVFICLTNAQAIEAVVFDNHGIAKVDNLKWLIDHSSIAPDLTQQFARRLEQINQASWVDAPVSGGVAGTEAGTLTIMAGGDIAALNAARPAIDAYAKRITHLGTVGAGQTAKLCNQTIVAATLNAIAEALSLARAAGLDASKLPEALQGGWADSALLPLFTPRMLLAQEHVIGGLDIMLKDINGTLDLAKKTQTPTALISTVQQNLLLASALGLGASEISALICLSHPESLASFQAQANQLN
ncbi:2-hydroxy-3-oxopropionate reductase [Paenalcaligenes hominis]|uniref:2-hydroxy-3-oxopropionate reductase n=1 Tax=Paenalcaligenes hominis TaxID=643674 RepID=A0A1U9K146_9BURK|nr:NAD(P)-dependent oxidoreductase [Paenalcaligenes hominis]AQS51770.1 2-hydroxy-3-oxopropionate reductase [Paenalcaligenes hominis]